MSHREPIKDYPIRRFKDGEITSQVDSVTIEQRIELNIDDGRLRLGMLCLPQDLEALATGFLYGEGALRRKKDLESIEVFPDENRVVVRGDFDDDSLDNISRRWTMGTGCGSGGTSRDVDSPAHMRVGAGPTATPQQLIDLMSQFTSRKSMWLKTGGVHTCALATAIDIVLHGEDVGRHNAFDKVVGMAILDDIDLTDKFMLTTGRLSAEIIAKAAAVGITILVSRSAVTSLAIELATRFGVTLVGFVRGKRLNVYTAFHRITD